MTKVEIIDKYKAYLTVEKALAEKSVGAYIGDITKFLHDIQMGVIYTPSCITNEATSSYLDSLYEKQIALRTISRARSSIRTFLIFLHQQGYLATPVSIEVERSKIPRQVPHFLSDDEFNVMLGNIKIFMLGGSRDRAIMKLFYFLGLTMSELLSLELSDISLAEHTISVWGDNKKKRTLPLPAGTYNDLEFYLLHCRNYQTPSKDCSNILFLNAKGNKLSNVTVFNHVKALGEKAKLPHPVSPATLRNTCIFKMFSSGMKVGEIQEALGISGLHTINTFLGYLAEK